MKTGHGLGCFCTSCASSGKPPWKSQHSKIEKLYSGNHIAARDKKLLDKLVKARAAYDDLREEILFGSNVSIHGRADLRPRKRDSTEGDETERSSTRAILKLVDLVDRGGSTKGLGECCSCCICKPDRPLARDVKARNRTPVHHGHHALSKISTERYRLAGGTRSSRHVRYIAKRIRSVPCTCTYELIKRKSQAMIKRMKMRPEIVTMGSEGIFETNGAYRAKALVRQSIEILKESKSRIKRDLTAGAKTSITKAKQSKLLLEDKLQAGVKKSLELLKATRRNMKTKVDDVKKSVQSNLQSGANNMEKLKDTHRKIARKMSSIKSSLQSAQPPKVIYAGKDRTKGLTKKNLPIKKDSFTKFRDKILNLEDMEEWMCEHECSPKECAPEDCLKILMKSKERRANYRESREGKDRFRQRTRKTGQSSTESGVNVQAHEKTVSTKVGPRKKELTRNVKPTFKTEPQITISVSAKNKQKRTRVSCICSDIETRKQRKGKINPGANRKKINRKFMTDLTGSDSKSRKDTSARTTTSKASSIGLIQHHATRVDTKPRATVSAGSLNRQAVRISSSFSFSIEFYKNKPTKVSQTQFDQEAVIPLSNDQSSRENAVKKRHNRYHASRPTQTHRPQKTTQRKFEKDTKTGEHALKRCFCNLKLKSNKTKVSKAKSATRGTPTPLKLKGLTSHSTDSVQTKRSLRHHNALRPYECEPDICIPGECDLVKCYEIIKERRHIKRHSAYTNTGSRTKSASSFTNSISSRSSKTIQAYLPNNNKVIQHTEQNNPSQIIPVKHSPTSQRQAARIGSSFSFNIEFHKDTPVNDSGERVISSYSREFSRRVKTPESKVMQYNFSEQDIKPGLKKGQRNREVGTKKHNVYSQLQRSIFTGKSKLIATKHKLRRCLCTLKLKPGKGRVNPQSITKMVMNTRSTITQTRKQRQLRLKERIQHYKPVPHACELGICVAGECHPYKCLKTLNKREGITPILHYEKYSNTNKKTRSSSSAISKSKPHRAKRMQSNIFTDKTAVGKYTDIKNNKMPQEIRKSPRYSNRQVVRIGSTFSFNIEFYKDRKLPINNKDDTSDALKAPRNIDSKKTSPLAIKHDSYVSPKKLKSANVKANILKDRGSQGDVRLDQVSVPVQVRKEQKNKRMDSIIKRCFCTLNPSKKRTKVKCVCKEMTSIGTETPIINEKLYPAMVSKGTKTKEIKYNLRPYECEPYVCIPGECDPYNCLETIKRRNYLKEFGTSTDHVLMKSGSSFTQNLTVSSGTGPDRKKLREQNTSTKVIKKRKYTTSLHPEIKSINSVSKKHSPQPANKSGDSITKNKARQVVRVGSSFSFDIEFYKDHQPLRERILIDNIPKANMIKIIDSRTVKSRKNIEMPIKKVLQSHHKAQAEDLNEKHKANGIKPMLKRCFCTLHALKKEKGIHSYTQVYTVSRVTVSKVTIAGTKIPTQGQEYDNEPNKNDNYRSKKEIEKIQMQLDSGEKQALSKSNSGFSFNEQEDFKKQISKSSWPNGLVNSKLNIDLQFLKDQNMICNVRSMDDAMASMNSSTVHEELIQKEYQSNEFRDNIYNFNVCPGQITGVNSFLKRSYCTMNINTGKKQYKLKPYECEPGICVPYECDPYECQKLLNRRLKVSKMSGTDATSRSASSYSNLTPSQRARKLQSKIQLRSAKTTHAREPVGGIKYRTVPNRHPGQKMVRIGSSFSFDITFSKNKSQEPSKYRKVQEQKPQYNSDTRSVKTNNQRTKGTRQKSVLRYSRDSQSGTSIVNRGTNPSPKLKRCFCTLKLHKRGKQQQHVLQSSSQATMTSRQRKMKGPKSVTTTTGQNTKPYKHLILDPHECEPGICLPGECNPYECLELIERRNIKYKTRGFSTPSVGSRSTSSGTRARRQRGQRVQSDLRRRRNRKSVATLKEVTRRGYTQSTKDLPTNRQVVRIGSTLSFNIEFYKNRTPHTDRIQAAAIALKTHQKKVKTKQPSSSSRGSIGRSIGQHSRDSQVGTKTAEHGSGAAPMLKRCLCTLKLQKEGKRTLQTKQIRQVNQGTKTRAYRPVPTLYTRSVMTNGMLKSYECEPGVCIPGECDPYECDKLIQKRLRRAFGTSTGRYRTRSAASSTSSTILRARKVQYAGKQQRTRDRPNQSKDIVVKPVRERPSINAISDRPSRQAVRIGSSFSFNVEFFKDKGGDTVTFAKLPEYIRNDTSTRMKPEKVKRRSAYSQNKKGTRRTDSQIGYNMRSTGTGVRPMLKRCFCTLSLKKPKKKQIQLDMLDAGTDTYKAANNTIPQFTRTAATRTKQVYHLRSYECEPGICIPGECDPYECLKKIRRRDIRSRMSGTHTSRGRSISNFISASGRANQTQSTSPRYKHRSTGNNNKYIVEEQRFKSIKNPFRQAVRISSSFSFSIEFYKDKLPELTEMYKLPNEERSKKIRIPDKTKSLRVKNKGICNDETCFRDGHSQSLGTRAYSRGAGVTSRLKRCFCTLKLQKMEKYQQQRIPDHSDAMTSTPRHYRHYQHRDESVSIAVGTKRRRTYNLKSYECEPYICVPGECDPYECLERINRRKMRHSGIGTENIHGYNRSTATFAPRSAKCRDTQCYRDPNSKCRSTQCYLKRQKMKESLAREPMHRYHRQSPTSDNSNRQSARIGSNFSFDIEFFKDRKYHKPGRKRVIYENLPTTTPSMKARMYTNRGSHGQHGLSHQQSQMIGPRTESRESDMRPLLKRCFCTLKLRKDLYGNTRNDTKTVNFVCLEAKPPLLPSAKIADKNYSINCIQTKPFISNTFNVCKCNQNATRITKQHAWKRNRENSTTKTHTEQVFFRNMIKKFAQICKPDKLQQHQIKKNTVKSEEVKISQLSNDLRHGQTFEMSNRIVTDCKLQDNSKSKSKKKKTVVSIDKINLNKCYAQLKLLIPKNECKTKLLKRSSRSLNVQHKPSINKRDPKKQSFKTLVVENDVKMFNLHRSKRIKTKISPDYSQKADEKSDKLIRPCNIYINNGKMSNVKRKTIIDEMKTIFPYTPNKFNGHVSNTTFLQNKETIKTIGVLLDDVNILNSKKNIIEAISLPLKKIFRIKEITKKVINLFKKSKRDLIYSKELFSENVRPEPRVIKRSERVNISKTDVLKTSKSDRRALRSKLCSISTVSIPKKSKSLKIAKAPEKCRLHNYSYIEQSDKKYSRFQSGDAGQAYIKPNIKYNNNFHCLYCQVLYDKDKTYLRNTKIPAFMDEKVVLTLVSPKQKHKHRKSVHLNDDAICGVKECATANRKHQNNTTSLPNNILRRYTNYNSKIQEDNGNKKQEANDTGSVKGILKNNSNKNQHKEKSIETPDLQDTNKLPSWKKNKMVCKTKKPCICCGGARKTVEPGDGPLSSANRFWKTTKRDNCKDTCLTETAEEAGKSKCIKIIEKFLPNMSGYHQGLHNEDKCIYDPMFSMRMDANSMALLNREEIYENVSRLKSEKKEEDSISPDELKRLHGKTCRCCICKSMKIRKANDQHNGLVNGGVNLSSLTAKASLLGRVLGIGREPCICGSAPCAVASQKMANKAAAKKKQKKKKPCVCGTNICESESLKIDMTNKIVTKKGGKELKKIIKKKKKDKMQDIEKQKRKEKANKEWLLRQERYQKEDAARKSKQKREEKRMNKQAKKYRDTNAWLLAAESILDIGQLIYKSATGLLRFSGRAVMDPKRSARFFIESKSDPSRIFTNLKNAWTDSGVNSTAQRVGLRIQSMPCWARIKACLEEYALTHYLVHMCDRNPKARLARKKRLVRKREPMDFECSLYMASLRKKPYLKVYNTFQWFYPHCLSLLHILRSVTDVILFLLAVVVWSPCLCCIELCRSLMCCTLCTG